VVTEKLSIVVAVRTTSPIVPETLPPPENSTVGTLVYPVPPDDTIILATVVDVRKTVTVAPESPPPVNATVGALV
jgi:hypothetical protein